MVDNLPLLKGAKNIEIVAWAPRFFQVARKQGCRRPLGVALLDRTSGGAACGIGKLGWIDVTSDDIMLTSEPERCGTGGGDAKHAAFTFERCVLPTGFCALALGTKMFSRRRPPAHKRVYNRRDST